ncbi:MAG: phosphopantothenoylcysteine decarboxylase [Elusimicrobiota bacterium]|jgi:phosphopantothenoylcysteine decarboxylase/phosphopantothenate--cysteine ligase|nr:phosphopantothenoylcysteine decarboxylase [Elusimicrobiota bacterium]
MKILLTLGATAEAIDGVRFITNFSTGKTGCALADYLAKAGHKVTALCGQYSQKPQIAKKIIFNDFADLNKKIKRQLSADSFDAVIHLAAVSDFSVNKVIADGKLYGPRKLKKISSASKVCIELKNNFKIIDKIKIYAKNKPLVIGFKLTNAANYAQRIGSAKKLNADMVVHNDLKDLKSGRRIFTLYKNGLRKKVIKGIAELAKQINEILNGHIS